MASGIEESSDEFAVLKNPIRRRILLNLYSRGELSASELKLITNVSYGTLYYHLEMMKPYIESAGKGRFRLNDNGRALLRRLMDEKTLPEEPRAAEWWEVLTLGNLLSLDRGRLGAIAAIGATALATTIYVSLKINVYPVLLHFRSGQPPITSWPASLSALFGYLIIAYLALRRDGGSPGLLLLSVSMSYLPVAAYTVAIYLCIDLLKFQLDVTSAQIGFMIAHVWQLLILASILTHSTGSGYSRTLPATLFFSYISLITYLFT